jgi:hypothetical protein
MRFLIVASLVALCLSLVSSCATGFVSYPARLVDEDGKFLTGWVTEQLDDGRVKFVCDDRSWGDNGVYFFDKFNPAGKRLVRGGIDSPISARFSRAPQ